MPLNLASPGIVVREVDLTVGRVDTASDKVGALVGPFAKGAVDLPILVETEQDLLDNFGKPYSADKHYEYWMVASSYLAYGGPLRVVRADDDDLKNAFSGTAGSIKIKSTEHYNDLGYDGSTITGVTVAARNPGSWANNLKVAIIDDLADQVLQFSTLPSNIQVGFGITQAVPPNTVVAGSGTTSLLTGYFKGIVTEVDTTLKKASVKILESVTEAGVSTSVDYQPNGIYKFGNTVATIHNNAGVATGTGSPTGNSDWFDQQAIQLTNSTINWNNIAERPGTSSFAEARDSRFDEVHVVVIDDTGEVTGNAGTILEKHLGLSKAKDGLYSLGSPSYWRKYLYNNSTNIFAGGAPAGIVTTSFGEGATNFTLSSDVGWDQNAQGIKYAGIGVTTLTLTGGKNYDGGSDEEAAGAFQVTLAGLAGGYQLFEDDNLNSADFILMGSANHTKETCQSLANKIISVAEIRKDAVAFVSPNRGAFLSDGSAGSVVVFDANQITDNVISFFAPVSSSSFAVFDSTYKYMYDRFADTFRYVPMNGDIAGLCARNDINNFPWFSPAGTARGAILNAVKLAYNPSQTQRDQLYSNRVNPIIFSPGGGIVLFGDKTGLSKASAFDRINVRRLFIFLENAISGAARDQMFEFNDEITRTNFVNIVEPFLRDVQAKRGIFDFRVICDETNNTAAIIDNNEFVADIFIKPARSINFIGLTFVATRTGVSFEEVIGSV
tara:strand:+ start:8401 stop:10569 length:2169 start_codon:yes stop_codon:yes gene_type:complete